LELSKSQKNVEAQTCNRQPFDLQSTFSQVIEVSFASRAAWQSSRQYLLRNSNELKTMRGKEVNLNENSDKHQLHNPKQSMNWPQAHISCPLHYPTQIHCHQHPSNQAPGPPLLRFPVRKGWPSAAISAINTSISPFGRESSWMPRPEAGTSETKLKEKQIDIAHRKNE
jgi:hypothetical protein